MEVYRHQVGGHSRLMKPRDSSKVFKPFSESEYMFYERLAALGATSTDSGPLHILKQFVPKYYGVTEVYVQARNTSGTAEERTTAKQGSQTRRRPFLEQHLATEASLIHPRFCESASCLLSSTTHHLSQDSAPSERECVTNGRRHFEGEKCTPRSVSPSSSPATLKYIVLQDLVYMYKKPCVLDLKMGRRQRKIGASVEKEKRQLEKSLRSTSHSMGFRLCGFQSYDRRTDALCYRDKYWGRKLTKDSLLHSIGLWFWDGTLFHYELIHPLISSLKVLHSCISELRHYRFWSSSLLWVYDAGLPDSKSRIQSLNVKMIDFANTIVLKDNSSTDDEYLFGLRNLISILEQLLTLASAETFSVTDMLDIWKPETTFPEVLSRHGGESTQSFTVDNDNTPSVPPTSNQELATGTPKKAIPPHTDHPPAENKPVAPEVVITADAAVQAEASHSSTIL